MNFVSVDVETANPGLTSICQIGIAIFRNGGLSEFWSSLARPIDHYFDETNALIHGISEKKVADVPTLIDSYSNITQHLNDQIVVCHTSFDRVALVLAADRYDLKKIECKWLDSARIARRAWPEFSQRGYGLSNLAKYFGFEFDHHSAPEDARVAGEIVCKQCAMPS